MSPPEFKYMFFFPLTHLHTHNEKVKMCFQKMFVHLLRMKYNTESILGRSTFDSDYSWESFGVGLQELSTPGLYTQYFHSSTNRWPSLYSIQKLPWSLWSNLCLKFTARLRDLTDNCMCGVQRWGSEVIYNKGYMEKIGPLWNENGWPSLQQNKFDLNSPWMLKKVTLPYT